MLGQDDTVVAPGPQRAAFVSLCERGAKLVYRECAGAGHAEAFAHSLDEQLDFFEARLSGEPLPPTLCQVQPAAKCKSAP